MCLSKEVNFHVAPSQLVACHTPIAPMVIGTATDLLLWYLPVTLTLGVS